MTVMQGKILKWGLIGLSVFVILFLSLGIHLYYVTDNFYQNELSKPQIQLSRIDFKEDIDSTEAKQIQTFVNGIEGIQKSYFNIKDDILVYSYYAGKQNSETVFKLLTEATHVIGEKFYVSSDKVNSGCPAMQKNGETSGLLKVYKVMFSIF